MSSKWFDSVFLPSLFERAGTDKSLWLSRKQTAICTENMERKTVRYDSDGYGTIYNHDNYSCEWNGRKVNLSYSKKNGCGSIEFSMTSEEAEVSRNAFHAERKAERIRVRENVKANKPERVAKHIEKASAKVNSLNKELADLSKELEETKDTEIINSVKEDIKFVEESLQEAQKDLDFWIA